MTPPAPAETVAPGKTTPVPKRTTYAPLSPLTVFCALVGVCGFVLVLKRK